MPYLGNEADNHLAYRCSGSRTSEARKEDGHETSGIDPPIY